MTERRGALDGVRGDAVTLPAAEAGEVDGPVEATGPARPADRADEATSTAPAEEAIATPPPPPPTVDAPAPDARLAAAGMAAVNASPAPPDSPAAEGAGTPVAAEGAGTPVAFPNPPPRRERAPRVRTPLRRRRWFRRTLATFFVLLLLAVTALAVYLFLSAREWRDQSDAYLASSLDLGSELATTRAELAGTNAELDAVREQLATLQRRMLELADEKNQVTDDWEIQQQLVEYQQRVSEAAGEVALALDQCVQGQQQLIGYLTQAQEQDGPRFDPEDLQAFETEVDSLCQAATEANIALQRELAR